MDLPTYFEDFLTAIRPTTDQRMRMNEAHQDLRNRLQKDRSLATILISMFIQGSYRRHTGLVGTKEHQCDVDLVAVTDLPSGMRPADALELFHPFLEMNYKGRYEPQGRSWCIQWDNEVTLDLVPTSAPSEANKRFFTAFGSGFAFEDPIFDRGTLRSQDLMLEAIRKEAKAGWQAEPLEIPDREAKVWTKTHPLAQIAWTADKNSACNGHYINVVRAIKWWRRMKEPLPKYPKGYPIEHLVGACCPSGIGSIAEGVASTFEAIINNYKSEAAAGQKPVLLDHGVDHDVFKRITPDDFCGFYRRVDPAARLASNARASETVTRSAELWRELFGNEFPKGPEDEEPKSKAHDIQVGGFSKPTAPAVPTGGRYA